MARRSSRVRWFGSDPKGFDPLLENGVDVQDGSWLYVGASLASRMAWTAPEKWQQELAERVEVGDAGLVVCDEAVSAPDVPIRAQVLQRFLAEGAPVASATSL